MFRDLANAVARDTLDHIFAVWDREGHALAVSTRIALHADKAGGRELVDLGPGLGVQVERYAKPFIPSLLAPSQHGRIIATHLRRSSTLGRCTVKVFQHQRSNRMDAMIYSSRQNKDQKGILLGRIQPQLRTRPKKQRPNIHRRARPMGRHIFRIQTHSQMHTLPEQLHRDLRHGNERRRVLHTLRILLRPENVDRLVVGRAEGFEAFVALLAVVEAGRHAVQAQEGVLDEFGGRPLAAGFGVAGFDVAVDFADAEANVVPVWRKVVVSD